MALFQSTFNKQVICMININMKCVKVAKYSNLGGKKKVQNILSPLLGTKNTKMGLNSFPV
jgi:hypothetical protein